MHQQQSAKRIVPTTVSSGQFINDPFFRGQFSGSFTDTSGQFNNGQISGNFTGNNGSQYVNGQFSGQFSGNATGTNDQFSGQFVGGFTGSIGGQFVSGELRANFNGKPTGSSGQFSGQFDGGLTYVSGGKVIQGVFSGSFTGTNGKLSGQFSGRLSNQGNDVTSGQHVYATSLTSNVVTSFRNQQSMGLGISLIVIGVLAIIFNGVGIAVTDDLGFVRHGFWCGALFIVTGGFGVAAASTKHNCWIIAFMVLSIISAASTISLLTIGIVGAKTAAACDSNDHISYGFVCFDGRIACCYLPPACHKNDQWRAAVAMEACLACFAFIVGCLSIWASVICCQAVCCCQRRHTAGMIHGYNPSFVFGQQKQLGEKGLPGGYPYWSHQYPSPPYQTAINSQAATTAPPAYPVSNPNEVAVTFETPAQEKDQKV